MFQTPPGGRWPGTRATVLHRSSGRARPRTLVQDTDHRLRAGEISGAQQDNDPVARALEDGHLAEFRVVVDARVGAGVGREDDSVMQKDANTIGHALGRLGVAIEWKWPGVIVPYWPAVNRGVRIGPGEERHASGNFRDRSKLRRVLGLRYARVGLRASVDRPRRNVRNRTMVPSAWSCDTPQRARASCTPDLSRRDRRPAPARWKKAARGRQSIAARPSRCPARQFRMLRRCRRPAGSPAIAPETPTRRCALQR